MGESSGTALLDEYNQLGLLSKLVAPTGAQNKAEETENPKKEPELVRLIEFPHPYRYGQTQTLAIDAYERRHKDEAAESEYKSYSIIVRRVIDDFRRIKKLQIEIQSKGLRDIFAQVGRPYRAVNVDANPIVVSRPFHPLFFLRDTLRKKADDKNILARTRQELQLLLEFINTKECLRDTITKFESLIPANRITFDMLWSLFPPNEVVYFHDEYVEQCFIVESCYPIYENLVLSGAVFHLVYATHDGTRFGLKSQKIVLPAFLGVVDIVPENLPIIPVSRLDKERQKRIREGLITRGKTYFELQSAKFTLRRHQGPMWSEKGNFMENAISFGEDKMTIHSNGRVVVDAQAYREVTEFGSTPFVSRTVKEFLARFDEKELAENDNTAENPIDTEPSHNASEMWGPSNGEEDAVKVSDAERVEWPKRLEKEKETIDLTDEDYMMCEHKVDVFLLDRKCWITVLVTDLQKIEWYPNPWSALQMDKDKKKLVRDLVKGFNTTQNVFTGFDDIVQGKGKGLIFLLHGKPGLGKTFTAGKYSPVDDDEYRLLTRSIEAIAEETKRPLYYVTTGELSTDVSKMETQLQNVFKLGWRWGAVVLLDEADVIMAKRDISDLSRSAIVAVFLRLIEYYQGLLFLTTNRVEDFDDAFYNRIHVMIEYPSLSQEARTQIWKGLLVEKKKNVVFLDESWKMDESKIYDILGELDVNGRDIRNLIRTAYGLARSRETDLGVRHIKDVMKETCHASNVDNIVRRLEFAAKRTMTMTAAKRETQAEDNDRKGEVDG